ncbi:sugar fermentation stimulation protein A [Tepidamorphus gemmatus]|uniref:Sugar fermentation stimulation protein homolog n=1 Tax=Tepidamorphus gemmatus TaxID=747076 RepID=A0A4R3MJE7_9HYPH|nr:DNA/RNA nuclease SfsA [Tepidamorphus gemmatus]TCT12682.1 sugar fermentation stimulation protein A [Tepidamorphus gemmatus]
MRFAAPLTEGRLVRRYKRFLADVALADGRTVTAHCANPGSMLGLADPGLRVWLSAAYDPKRKLAWSLELVEVDLGAGPAIVGINTGHPNRLVAEAVGSGLVPELAGYEDLRREVKYGRNSRIDLLLTRCAHPDCYVEVKNVHLMRTAGLAEFPDSVTARGAKHLDELAAMVGRGARAVMFFLVQRGDADRLAIARDIDPGYAAALARARSAGVEVLAYRCKVTPEAIELDAPLTCED